MKAYTTTRDITINDELVAAGTIVKAAFNDKTGRTAVVVEGLGRGFLQVAPVRF